MYWAELAARCAPACLRALQRACFRLLGYFRIWFGYLERGAARLCLSTRKDRWTGIGARKGTMC
jgi:hypothetical protein